jgi:hypothetical protein
MEPHDLERYIKDIKENWLLRRGKSELLRHLEGGKELTMREAVQAKCYDCNCGYDEVDDCGILTCPLHDFMPYKKGGPRKRPQSDQQKAEFAARMAATRKKISTDTQP